MKIISCVCGFVWCFLRAQAQSDAPVEYFGIEHGLSNNAVTSICQDRYGFMWFGTYDGLNRYDGYNFRIFRNQPGDSLSLINNRIVDIAGDQEHKLWIGTKGGICIYDPFTATFAPAWYYPHDAQEPRQLIVTINDIEVDEEGNVFIATAGEGLLLCRKGAQQIVQLPYRRGSEIAYTFHAQSIKFDNRQRLWLFIQGEGIGMLPQVDTEIKLVSNWPRSGTCLLPDNRGKVWVGSENGLFQYAIDSGRTTDYTRLLSSRMVVDLHLDKSSNSLWVATDGGGINILQLSTEEMRYLLQGHGKNTLTSGAVFAICEDTDGRKWIGTLRGGVNMIDRRKNKFRTIAHEPLNENSLINDFILSFCEDERGHLWIGTDGEGLSYWNRQESRFTHFVHDPSDWHSLSNNYITSILRDRDNTIWIATYGGGICRYNRNDRTFSRYQCFNTKYGYEDRNVWSLYEDSFGTLWAGTCTGGGLYRFNHDSDRFELFDERLTDVIVLFEDNARRLWAGTFNALIEVDRAQHLHRRIGSRYPVRAICQDRDNNLWIGTEGGGLNLLDRETKEFTAFTEDEGLCSNSVLNILPDDMGYLWLSTFNGIGKFDLRQRTFRNFYASDGLQCNQFNYNAALRLQSGEMAFGGIRGFNLFYPWHIESTDGFPSLVVTDFRINNTPIEHNSALAKGKNVYNLDKLTLPYDNAVVSIDFVALEYSASDKIEYAYYLEGWDKAWNFTGKSKTANYSRLYEGDYTLRIRSTNADGVWNREERTIRISVLPPWYRAWWAYGLYAGVTLALLAFYFHYQRKQARLTYEVKIAVINAEKEKELNEKKLAFFTNVSHEFRTPLTLIINPVKEWLYSDQKQIESKDVSIIYRNARRLLSLVDQLLLFRRADSDEDTLKIVKINFANLCREVFVCFTHQAAARKIAYEFTCNREDIELYADREQTEIALFNLISNALKFTPEGGRVSIVLTDAAQNVQFRVRDTGCGIPPETGQKLFDKFHQVMVGKAARGGFGIGLYLVKKFVGNHHGTIAYESRVNEGTTFCVTLQKGKEHFAGRLIFEDVEENSVFLEELVEEPEVTVDEPLQKDRALDELIQDNRTMLVVDDNQQIRRYMRQIFAGYEVYEAEGAEEALVLAREHLPDIIICDVLMAGKSGVEFCCQVKENPALNHIPVILLTASSSPEIKLKGLEGGADDYVTKPFDKDLLRARVEGLLRNRTALRQHFYNKVTLQAGDKKLSEEYRTFLEKCVAITESHLDEPDFNIRALADEMGMSHSNLYKKIKSAAGRSASEFVRFIRLRKAAELLIGTDCNINEAAFSVGFSDVKYFREQFHKMFDMNPSDYMRKFRGAFQKNYKLNEKLSKTKGERE